MTTTLSVTTLFLDIGGVLLANGWDHTMRQKAAEKFGLDYEEMNDSLGAGRVGTIGAGVKNESTCLRRINRQSHPDKSASPGNL